MSAIISWMIQNKLQAKVGSLVIGSSGIVALILGMGEHLKTEIDNVDRRIMAKDAEIRQYVNSKHDIVMEQMLLMREDSRDIKTMIRTVDDRLYKLSNKLKE